MNAGELIAKLQHVPPETPVEIATCPRPDEWYEIADCEVGNNHRDHQVFIINTD